MKNIFLLNCIAIFILLSSGTFCWAIDKTKLPKNMNSSSIGREFYFSFIPSWENGTDDYLKIYVVSNKRTKVKVEVKGKNFTEEKYTVPNEILEFTLTPNQGQPYRKAPNEIPRIDNVFLKSAVHIIADEPVICYGATKYKYASDAFLILPVSSLGSKYIVASFADPTSNQIQWLSGYTSITATEDATEVDFTLGGNDWSRTVSGLEPGQKSNWTMDAGDVLLIASLGQYSDLSGSIIESDKPIAVVSGNYCAYVPTNCGSCNLLEEMEFPVETWGLEYHVPNIFGRKKNPYIKIFAQEPKTDIYRDGQKIGFMRDGGGTETKGYLSLRADSDGNPRPIVLSGNKPIGVTLYNTAYADDEVSSDPFQMSLVPLEKYTNDAYLFTPGIEGGENFPKNYIALCYQPNEVDGIPSNFEIGMLESGNIVWQKLANYSNDPGVAFKTVNNKKYNLKTFELPVNGVYRLKADTAFQCYSYGFTDYASYGLPSFWGESNFFEGLIDTLPPVVDYELDCAGNVTGIIRDSADGSASKSGISLFFLNTPESKNYKLSYDDFIPCEDSVFNWRLERISKRHDANAVIIVNDCSDNYDTIFVNYIDSNRIFIQQNKGGYGEVNYGEEDTINFNVYNASNEHTARVEKIKFQSTDSLYHKYFKIVSIAGETLFSLPVLIPPRDSIEIKVKFKTDSLGIFRDSLGIGDNCVFEYWQGVSLSALSKGALISTSDINYKETNVSSKFLKSFIISNNGNSDLNITGVKLPNQRGELDGVQFLIFNTDFIDYLNISETKPLILSPGTRSTFEVVFQPDSEKVYIDSIVISSNTVLIAGTTDSICYLTGIGEIPIDVSENSERRISVYPNPSNDILFIENLPADCEQIAIHDEQGKLIDVIKFKKGDESIKISTKDLNSGYYYLRFYSKNNSFNLGFVITH